MALPSVLKWSLNPCYSAEAAGKAVDPSHKGGVLVLWTAVGRTWTSSGVASGTLGCLQTSTLRDTAVRYSETVSKPQALSWGVSLGCTT